MDIKCQHCGGDFQSNPDGSIVCKKCKCVFRVTVCYWNTKCFAEHHPEYGKVENKSEKPKKRRRGRRIKMKDDD